MSHRKTRTIPDALLRETIKFIDNAIPRRGRLDCCPYCGSQPFWPCFEGCEILNAKILLRNLRDLRKPVEATP